MNKLLEMKTKRADLIKESATAYDKFLESKTAEDKEAYAGIEAQITELDEQIAELEKINAREAEMLGSGKPVIKEEKKDVKNEKSKMLESYLRGNKEFREDVIDTNGNAVAPKDLEGNVTKQARDLSVMRQIADVRSAPHDRVIPVEGPGAIGASGWQGDGGFSSDNISLGSEEMKAYAVGRELVVGRDKVEDEAINLTQYLLDTFSYTNAKSMEEAFFTGDGSHKPTGVIGAASQVLTAAASTFALEDLKALYFAVPQEFRKNGTWLFTDELIQIISDFKDDNGNYVFPQHEPITHIWGRPVMSTPYLDAEVADGNTIALFGDFSKYRIQDRDNIYIKVLEEKNAPDFTYLIYQRVDGKLLVADAVQKLVVQSA